MIRWLRAGGAALLTACAARGGAGPGAAASNPAPAPPAPARPVERHALPQAVRYGPSAVRYLIHRRLQIPTPCLCQAISLLRQFLGLTCRMSKL